MTLQNARSMLVQHRQDYNRDRLGWLPARLYRLFADARPKARG
ncbi:hypothetical protein [Stappia sp.]